LKITSNTSHKELLRRERGALRGTKIFVGVV